MFLTCNHFAVIYKSKAESLFASLPPFIIIEDLRIYRVFFTHSEINLCYHFPQLSKLPFCKFVYQFCFQPVRIKYQSQMLA